MKYRIIAFLLALSAITTYGRQPQRGYRGFIEWSNDLTSQQNFYTNETVLYTGATTSHGSQINPMWYIGAGLTVEYCNQYETFMVPVFAHTRADFQFGKFTPFADFRLGCNLGEGGLGAYISPSIGYRFNWGRKFGMNLGLGMTVKTYNVDIYDGVYDADTGYLLIQYIGHETRAKAYFTFRLGIEF